MILSERFLRFCLALMGNTLFYAGTGYFQRPSHPLPVTSLDEWIGYTPQAALPYISFFALIMLAFLKASPNRVRDLTWQIPVVSGVGALVFIFIPTHVPHTMPCTFSDLSNQLCYLVRTLDTPLNCFPSLHAAISALCAFALMQESTFEKVIYWLWVLAICWAAIALRQHLIIDIVAGLVLAWLCLNYLPKEDNQSHS